jgi:signal transduction histidine kinase
MKKKSFSQTIPRGLFVEVLKTAQALPEADLPSSAQLLDSWEQGVRVHVTGKPIGGAYVLTFPQLKEFKGDALVNELKERSEVSISLSKEQWLNVRIRPFQPYLLWKLAIAALGLLLAWIFLSIWGIKRLDLPLQSLLEAAQRFGIDMQTPPLPVTGPAEIQKVIEAFNEMQQRIRRLLDDRTQMLAAISHDLRTPITRLQLRAEYLKGTPQYDKALEDLNDMENMIDSVLAFARSHMQVEPMDHFDLNVLLETLCDDLSDMGHSVTYHPSVSRQPYFGRLGALKRALNNVIENAIKYGKSAEVSLHHYASYWQIKVADQGPGIAADQMEKVFTPFYRVDLSRSSKIRGTGLGLTVARDIIRAHGGDITLHHQEPRGLVVLITLPFVNENFS